MFARILGSAGVRVSYRGVGDRSFVIGYIHFPFSARARTFGIDIG